jgi:hypothetical protein
MKKIVKLTESDLNRIVKKVLKEQVTDPEMSGSWERSKYEPTPRESGVKDVFGKYGEDMLPNIIRYLRKNPDAILRRMSKMYPEIYMRHIPTEGPLDETTIEVDPDDDSSINKIKGKLGPDDTLRVRDLEE